VETQEGGAPFELPLAERILKKAEKGGVNGVAPMPRMWGGLQQQIMEAKSTENKKKNKKKTKEPKNKKQDKKNGHKNPYKAKQENREGDSGRGVELVSSSKTPDGNC